jgi:hypothetical protein
MFKKTLVVGALMAFIGFAGFAGPIIGLQLQPQEGASVAFCAGWSFGDILLQGSKENFGIWSGLYSFETLWTPPGYRVGIGIDLEWDTDGNIGYQDLTMVAGVSHTWGAFNGYLDLVVSSTGEFSPRIGVNIFLDNLLPAQANE